MNDAYHLNVHNDREEEEEEVKFIQIKKNRKGKIFATYFECEYAVCVFVYVRGGGARGRKKKMKRKLSRGCKIVKNRENSNNATVL